MIPPELQPRSFRPYISSSVSAPSFSSTPSFNNFSSDPNPNPSDARPSSRRSLNNNISRFRPSLSLLTTPASPSLSSHAPPSFSTSVAPRRRHSHRGPTVF
ncbi:hypothetical protein L484_022740 [Morus notabilis]|uniref:Uncharacterized protein n=1 Tax=Morus notabilis TaxID=981085 RepID=W9T0G0_9ROSA|nr:hypothetical protein L484_022740 [Morus notabilis]